MTELEKALNGLAFDRRSNDVREFQGKVKKLCFEFNHTEPGSERKTEIIKELVSGYNPYVLLKMDSNVCLEKISISKECV